MPRSVLFRIKELIRKRLYVATVHAEEEMDNDGLTIFDVESVLLTGEIVELPPGCGGVQVRTDWQTCYPDGVQ